MRQATLLALAAALAISAGCDGLSNEVFTEGEGSLSGRLVLDGAPVDNALLYVVGHQDVTASTDADGKFRFGEIPSGPQSIVADDGQGHGRRFNALIVQSRQTDAGTISAETYGRISGVVLTDDGGSPDGAHVESPGTPYGVTVGADGGFLFEDVPPGCYPLVAVLAGYKLARADACPIGGHPVSVTMTLTSGCTPEAEVCDGLDNDCDGLVDEEDVCSSCPGGCNPGEVCNEATGVCEPDPCALVTCGGGQVCIDGQCFRDCRMSGCLGQGETCNQQTGLCELTCGDHDADGYSCKQDCDDTDSATHPGAVETCDARDNDCDGTIDEDGVCDMCSVTGRPCEIDEYCGGNDLCHHRPDADDSSGSGWSGNCGSPCPEVCCPTGMSCDGQGRCMPDSEPTVCSEVPAEPESAADCDGFLQDHYCEVAGTVEQAEFTAEGAGFGMAAISLELAAGQGSFQIPIPTGIANPISVGQMVRVRAAAYGNPISIEVIDDSGMTLLAFVNMRHFEMGIADLLDKLAITAAYGPALCAPVSFEQPPIQAEGAYRQTSELKFRNRYNAEQIFGIVAPGETTVAYSDGQPYWATNVFAYRGLVEADCDPDCGYMVVSYARTICVVDEDSDGFCRNLEDCNDNDASIHPGATEICDELDNDCDGTVDDGYPQKGLVCTRGLGECRREGLYVCNTMGDGVTCDADDVQGVPELCDGLDNDCDGVIDEDFGCLAGETRMCGSDVGTCQTGTQTCTGQCAWAAECVGEVGSETEICDQLDNDCDGQIDEGDVCGIACTSDADCSGDEICEAGICTRPAGDPEIDLSPSELDFGAVQVGGSATGSIMAQNIGETDLTIASLTLEPGSDAEFSLGGDPPMPAVVQPGGTVELTVIFTPSSETRFSASLAVASNDPASPEVSVPILGVGTGCSPEAEICDGIDNDCDGQIDDGVDLCGAGNVCEQGNCYPDCRVSGCAAGETCNSQTGVCEADCITDVDGDGYCAETDDCNDDDAEVHPGVPDICGDRVDNDCDGQVDEEC